MSAEIRFAIIANPRTGTNHYIDLLNSHEEMTCHREVFHRDSVFLEDGTHDELVAERNNDPAGFLQRLYQSSPTRVCGFKIFMDQNDDILNSVIDHPDIRKIVLFRPNLLAVHSSDQIAVAEQNWVEVADKASVHVSKPAGTESGQKTRPKVVFDAQDFERRIFTYERHYKYVIDRLNETNQAYLFTTYEDYTNDSFFRRAFPFLGLTQPNITHSRIRRMNSGDILSRYENPKDVREYLEKVGRMHWAHEGYMLWSS